MVFSDGHGALALAHSRKSIGRNLLPPVNNGAHASNMNGSSPIARRICSSNTRRFFAVASFNAATNCNHLTHSKNFSQFYHSAGAKSIPNQLVARFVDNFGEFVKGNIACRVDGSRIIFQTDFDRRDAVHLRKRVVYVFLAVLTHHALDF